jgi:DNA-binding PucR family transcriptional regulator
MTVIYKGLIASDQRTYQVIADVAAATLDAYLACDRHLERTAAALHVHVNTVRYRLGKVQENLGVDLHDVETRFLLELALRVQAVLNRA